MLSPYKEGIKLAIKLTPNAKRDAFLRIEQDRLCVSVTAIPEKGKANTALIKLLSKKLRLPKSSIQIIAGDTSRLKTVLITGDSEILLVSLKDAFQDLGTV